MVENERRARGEMKRRNRWEAKTGGSFPTTCDIRFVCVGGGVSF